jgi:hypothetical protein
MASSQHWHNYPEGTLGVRGRPDWQWQDGHTTLEKEMAYWGPFHYSCLLLLVGNIFLLLLFLQCWGPNKSFATEPQFSLVIGNTLYSQDEDHLSPIS